MPPTFRSDRHGQSAGPSHEDRRHLWISAEAAKNRIVLRTVAGGAKYAAALIDHMELPDVLGTIAGNDSVAIVCASKQIVPKVLIQIKEGYPQAERALRERAATDSPD
ncbi:arginine repressor [Actinomyces qiguomingii]|uniref:arginine repressor n=1 Tax=Actinomyces qiguomingii TaxID=2057800 RepID=UPI000CA00C45|nr:arginine repressor [Actinomyces qiguomingii]